MFCRVSFRGGGGGIYGYLLREIFFLEFVGSKNISKVRVEMSI